jgi:tetratricopeptide (TPR) repeat protein
MNKLSSSALVLSLAACGLALAAWLDRRSAEASVNPLTFSPEDQLATIRRELADQAERQSALERELESLRARAELSAAAAERTPAAAAESALASAQPAALASAQDAANAAPIAALSSQQAYERLLGELSWDQRELLWQELRESKQLDAVLALFEERARLDPNNPETLVDLGGAYLQKIQEVGNSPLAGKWAMKADEQFDRALELNPQHWEARFTKAVSLSFWPPVLGKQNEAISHFEKLVAQQEQGPAQAHYSEVYVLLGNMHQQMGASDKALSTWKQGLVLFPDNASLLKQVQLAGG